MDTNQTQVNLPPDNSQGWYKATILRRWVANIIDGLIFIPVAIVLLLIFKFTNNSISSLLQLLFWIYSVLFIWRNGATLGKKLLKIQVVDTNYQPVSLWKAFLREVIGKFISGLIFGLGYFWAIWDKDRQAWHDKIAGTYVVTKIPNNGKNSIGLFVIVGLIVFIPIISILAAVVILAINPPELLKRSRDESRLFDINNLKNEIDISIESNPEISLCGNTPVPCEGKSNSSDNNNRKVDGSGWVKVDLTKAISSASALPVDPVNSSVYFYRYCSDGKKWEIDTRFESEQYKKKQLPNPVDSTGLYKIGSDLNVCK